MGESTRLPLLWPGFDSRTRRNMWVEFVVGSRPCSKGFSPGFTGFPPSSKTNTSKFLFDLATVNEERIVAPGNGLTTNKINKLKSHCKFHYHYYLCELDDLFPVFFPRERVIAHDQRSLRVFSLL